MELTRSGRSIKPDVHCSFPLAFIPHNGQLIKTLGAIIKMLSPGALDIVQKAFQKWHRASAGCVQLDFYDHQPLSFSSLWKSKRGQTQTRLEPRPNAIWSDLALSFSLSLFIFPNSPWICIICSRQATRLFGLSCRIYSRTNAAHLRCKALLCLQRFPLGLVHLYGEWSGTCNLHHESGEAENCSLACAGHCCCCSLPIKAIRICLLHKFASTSARDIDAH